MFQSNRSRRKLLERRVARGLTVAVIVLMASAGQAYGTTGSALPGSLNTGPMIAHSAEELAGELNAESIQAFNVRIISQHVNRKKGLDAVVQVKSDQNSRYQATIYRKTRPEVIVYSNGQAGSTVEIRWDGRDERGIPVANGSYILKIAAIDLGGLTHTNLVQLEVNNAQSSPSDSSSTNTVPTTQSPVSEPAPQVAIISYTADGAATIVGRLACAFVPAASGKLGKLKIAAISTGTQAFIRADNGGTPGEIVAAYDLSPQTDLSRIYFEEIASPVSPASIEQGKTYWLEGPGTAIYSSAYAQTFEWSYVYYLWFDSGWRRPFAMELDVTPL